MTRPPVRRHEIVLHGQPMRYRSCGDEGPVIVLLHGMAGSSSTWNPVMPALGATCRVLAPDMLGHGESAKPLTGDYSLGSHASGVRDLMAALDLDRATVVGHSLGGGVALQFAYQFPERTDRLVLVSSGGLGREVNALLRLASLPGFEYLLAALSINQITSAGNLIGTLLTRVGLRPSTDVEQSWRSFCSFADPATRVAFIKTIRSVIHAGGQRVSAVDRLYLAAEMPTLVVWGERDGIIPVAHGVAAHELLPDSRLELLPGAGHYPHRDDPLRFAEAVLDFMASTACANLSAQRLRQLLVESVAAAAETPAG